MFEFADGGFGHVVHFVFDDVFDGCPHVHSFVADLDFYGRNPGNFGVGFDHGDDVEPGVAVGLGIFDVVAFFDNVDAGAAFEPFYDGVDVVLKGNDNADAADVADLSFDFLDGGETLAFHLSRG